MDGFCEDDQGMHLQIDNDLRELGRVTAALEVFAASCDLDGAVMEALELVLDELLNNTISYGFPDGGGHTISVEIELIDENVVLRISDDGISYMNGYPIIAGQVRETKDASCLQF